MRKLETALAARDPASIAGLVPSHRDGDDAARRLLQRYEALRIEDVTPRVTQTSQAFIFTGELIDKATSEPVAGPFQIEYYRDEGWFLAEGARTGEQDDQPLGPELQPRHVARR